MANRSKATGPQPNKALADYFWDIPAQLGERAQRYVAASSFGNGGDATSVGYTAAQLKSAARWRRIHGALMQLSERHRRVLAVSYTTVTHPLRDGVQHFERGGDDDSEENDKARRCELADRLAALDKALKERARHELGGDAHLRALEYLERDKAEARPGSAEPDPRALRDKARKKLGKQVDKLLKRWRAEGVARTAVRLTDERFELERQLWHDLCRSLERRVEGVRRLQTLIPDDGDGDASNELLAAAARIRTYLSTASQRAAAATIEEVAAAHKAWAEVWGGEAKPPKRQGVKIARFEGRTEAGAAA